MTLANLASDGFDAVAMIVNDENINQLEAMQFELVYNIQQDCLLKLNLTTIITIIIKI